jgi:hypothetical protein
MKNKYGFDIEAGANPFYEMSQPKLEAGDDWKTAKRQEYVAEAQRYGNFIDFLVWLNQMPFSFVPTQSPVMVRAPNYYVGKNLLNPTPRPLIDTKANYRSKNMVEPFIIDGADPAIKNLPTKNYNKQGDQFTSHIPTNELIDPWHYANISPTWINQQLRREPSLESPIARGLPTEAMIDFNKPQLQYTNPANIFTNLRAIPGLPLALSPFAGTKVAEAVPALKSVLGNTKNPLETVSEPVAKGLLDALVTGAKVVGPARQLVPEPIKAKIPAHVRAMLHYFVGGGEPTDLGLKHEQVAKYTAHIPHGRAGLLPEDYENAFRMYDQFAVAGKVPKYKHEDAIPAVTGTDKAVYRSLNKFFQDQETGDIYDDYRFYDLRAERRGDLSTSISHSKVLGRLGKAALDALSPKRHLADISGRAQDDYEFRVWLAQKGTPFPVVIKNPKTGVTEINVTAPRTPTGFENGMVAPELFQLMDRFRRK